MIERAERLRSDSLIMMKRKARCTRNYSWPIGNAYFVDFRQSRRVYTWNASPLRRRQVLQCEFRSNAEVWVPPRSRESVELVEPDHHLGKFADGRSTLNWTRKRPSCHNYPMVTRNEVKLVVVRLGICVSILNVSSRISLQVVKIRLACLDFLCALSCDH